MRKVRHRIGEKIKVEVEEEFLVIYDIKKRHPKSMLYISSFYASKSVHLRFFKKSF